MDKWFRSKWFVRGISLVLAVLLYVFVSVDTETTDSDNRIPFLPSSSTETESVENVPVEIRMDNEQYVVAGVPETVTVHLEGTSGLLVATARQRNFDVFVDLQGLELGEHTVELKTENLPSDLTATIEPQYVDIVIEERATADFTVNVDFINSDQLPDGYEVGEVSVNPESVSITSANRIIEQIGIVKAYVDLSGLTESIEIEVPVNVYDSQGNELNVRMEPETVSVSVELVNPSKSVPVSVPTTGTLPEGLSLLSIEPEIEEIEVFATSEVLEDIDEIETYPINLSGISESREMELRLDLPENVQTQEIDTINISIEVEQTRTIEDIFIDVEGIEDGQEVSFLDPSEQIFSITVTGNDQDVSDLTEEDFRAYIEVNGLDEGEHQVPLIIEGPDNISIETDQEEILIEII